MYYECHITLKPEFEEKVTPIAESFGFKISKITDDDVMGPGKHMYCTSRSESFEDIRGRMQGLTDSLHKTNIPMQRRKIEHCIFDERESVSLET